MISDDFRIRFTSEISMRSLKRIPRSERASDPAVLPEGRSSPPNGANPAPRVPMGPRSRFLWPLYLRLSSSYKAANGDRGICE
jgi:hypothetical protein